MSHDCAVDGCGRQISSAMAMCPPHWHRVPEHLRHAVWATWRARMAAVGTDGYREAVAAHEAAKRDAAEAAAGGGDA